MKRVFALILIVLLIVALTGCESGKRSADEISAAEMDDRMFMMVSRERYGDVYVCKQSGVMYWCSRGAYNYGTLTLLVDAENRPMIWDGR